MSMQWYTVENEGDGRKLPEWVRSVGVREDGVIFVPGEMAGASERDVFMCSHYDATPSVTYLKHRFFPLDWIVSEFPKAREMGEVVRNKLREAGVIE